ncbi:DUF3261 domain-containing protein [Silanimonas sp.]|uniref:DUF3261 domain-containing protein n=1 Tax=Silanimonas sp. TaxID=1929290 RepID=UPI0037CB77C2
MQRLKARIISRLGALPLLVAALLLAGCAGAPHGAGDGGARLDATWPLSTGDLPAPLALQQQLVIERGGQKRTFDAMLEVDADGLRLAVLAAGQVALTLHWREGVLDQQRADWLPPQLDGERVLQDLQFALWPVEALQRAAPQGWQVVERGAVREIAFAGRPVVVIQQRDAGRFTLERRDDGYRLDVQSVLVEEPKP